MVSRKIVALLLFFIYSRAVSGQDTVFVQKHIFDEAVVNVDSDGRNLVVRTTHSLYVLGDSGFEEIKRISLTGGRYTWVRTGAKGRSFATYNTDYVPVYKRATEGQILRYLPGPFHLNITLGENERGFFVAYKGDLLQYEVNDFYSLQHKGRSIRHVYNDDSLKITSTYSGVFLDTLYTSYSEQGVSGLDYSNGEVCKINGRYYLCRDEIFVLKENRWVQITQSITNPRFRKLILYEGSVYFLSEDAVGRIDLASGNVIDAKFTSTVRLNDMEFINGQLLVASGDGNLYLFDQKAQTGKIQVGSVIYDINFSEKGIVLSCEDGMYSVDLSREKAEKMIPLAGAVQSLYAESDLLITTYSGLYVMHNGKLYSVVPQVEFNRYALSQWQDRIFAGSIEGLFVLDRGQLLYDVIPGLTPIQVKTTSWVQYVLVLMALLVVLFAVLYFRIQRKKKGLEVEIRKKTNITPESIREAMLQNEDLISVEAIAEHFQTSTVQLNRILKRYETSGLVLVKSIKEEIFADLLQRNAEWDEISRRLGYSIAYIRRNLLKKPK